MSQSPAVEVRHVGKSFGPTRALDDVSFEFRPGEIFAMVGANGAGKSTLIKIICGYYPDFEGEILVGGEPVSFTSPHDATAKGIATVHQIINQGVIQTMTVAENLALAELLSSEEGSLFYKPKVIEARAREIAARMGLDHLDLNQEVSELEQSDRQMIAIARALATNPKLLILDEPTSSISERETEVLFEKLFRLREEGVSILYVSHRLHEIERIADRVGVIRDGKYGGVLERPFKVKEIVTAMVGEIEDKTASRQRKDYAADAVPKLELRDLVVQPGHKPINLKVHAGEILGITGLIGAGKSELAQVLFGLAEPMSGQLLIDGKPVHSKTVAEAIGNGVFMVPEDRSNNAVIPEFNLRKNITLPFLGSFSNAFGLMKHRLESREATRMVNAMGVKCESELSDISELSGGNQQKVVVARWLMKNFNVLILDEPYQGVDIRSRHDINTYIRAKLWGSALIVLAADLDEVLEVADRVVVMNHGMIVGEQYIDAVDRPTLLHWTSQSPDEVTQAVG